MENFTVYFTRANGTKGKDTFTANNKREAMADFRECYRYTTDGKPALWSELLIKNELEESQ